MAQIISWRRNPPASIKLTLLTGLHSQTRKRVFSSLSKQLPNFSLGIDASQVAAKNQECLTCHILEKVHQSLKNMLPENLPQKIVLLMPEEADTEIFIESLGHHQTSLPPLEIDSVACIVEAENFWLNLTTERYTHNAHNVEDGLEVPELFASQIEYCDAVYLIHFNRLSLYELEKISYTIRLLQPRAEIIMNREERISVQSIAGRFDEWETKQGSMWQRAITDSKEFEQPCLTPSAPFSAVVFRRRRPIHPERFYDLVVNWPDTVFRTIGKLWIPTKNHLMFHFHQVGPIAMSFSVEREWLANFSESEKWQIFQQDPSLFRFWSDKYADRYTELVIIGEEVDRADIVAKLEKTLLTDWEMRMDWSKFNDPLLHGLDEEEAEMTPSKVEEPKRHLKLVYSEKHSENEV